MAQIDTRSANRVMSQEPDTPAGRVLSRHFSRPAEQRGSGPGKGHLRGAGPGNGTPPGGNGNGAPPGSQGGTTTTTVPGSLPTTGADLLGMGIAAVGALGIGGASLVIARRRRHGV